MSDEPFIIREDERKCDLQLASLSILQKKMGFRFGFDAVALADFCAARRNERAIDLGTGTGILPLLIYGREPTATFDALEIDPAMADMARRSALGNGLAEVIRVLCGDIRAVREYYTGGTYTLVVCNPPYLTEVSGRAAPGGARMSAAAEQSCAFSDVADAARYLLKNGGRFCLCIPPKRMAEVFSTLTRARIEPKRARFVHSNARKGARLMLLEGVLNARPGLTVLPPLIVKDASGADTDDVRRMYHLP